MLTLQITHPSLKCFSWFLFNKSRLMWNHRYCEFKDLWISRAYFTILTPKQTHKSAKFIWHFMTYNSTWQWVTRHKNQWDLTLSVCRHNGLVDEAAILDFWSASVSRLISSRITLYVKIRIFDQQIWAFLEETDISVI